MEALRRRIETQLMSLTGLALAMLFTLGMLGGIDQLARPGDEAPQWAQNTSTRA